MGKFDDTYRSILNIIAEATLEKMSKVDQDAVNSGKATRIQSRIKFYQEALDGKQLQKNRTALQEVYM